MKILLFLCFFLSSYVVFAQQVSSLSEKELQIALELFEEDFKAAIEQDFDSISLQKVQLGNYGLFTPSWIEEETEYTYFLSDYLNKPYFKEALEQLFNSDDIQQKELAYSLIGAAGAKAYEPLIWEQLKTNELNEILHVPLTILLYLRTKETTALFDLLFEHKIKGEVLWIIGAMMSFLDKDALRATAYQGIDSPDDLEKQFAISLLAYTGQNEQTNALLLDSLKTWDDATKRQVIHVLKELKVGNLLKELEPLLQNPSLNRGILYALANSPSPKDVDYLKEKAAAQTIISRELLSAFCLSSNIDAVRYWLELLRTKENADCYFTVNMQPLLISDALLPDLQKTIVEVKDPMLVGRLSKLLKGRTDKVSIQILMGLLKHENSTVRYGARCTLSEHHSPELEKELLLLLNDNGCADWQILKWLIQHKVEGLHSRFEALYEKEGVNTLCNETAFLYLANFPKPSYLKLFKSILEDPESSQSLKNSAFLGIGQLKDKKTVDFLIKKCAEEKDDHLIIPYLRVLKEMKSPKVKAFIGSYKNSKNMAIRKLAFEALID